MYKATDQLQSESGQYALGTMAGARNENNPIIQDAFPSITIEDAVPTQGSTGTQRAGAGGFQWMTLNFEVDTDTIGPKGDTTDPGFARVSMKSASSGAVLDIGTIDNSNADFLPVTLGGSIGLIMQDLFSSVTLNPAFAFGLFDNVSVVAGLVPLEPDVTVLGGDYNDDGVVDAADYTLWRDNVDQPAGTLPNDVDGGVIGDAQYNTWAENYGLPTEPMAIPEPAAAVLTLLALAAACRRR